MYDLRGVRYCYNIQYLLISLIFVLMIRTSPFSRCIFKRQKSKLKSQDFSALGEQLQLRIYDYVVDMFYWLDNNRSISESMKNRMNSLLFLCAFLYGLKIRFIFDIAIDINILETIFASDSFLSPLRTCLDETQNECLLSRSRCMFSFFQVYYEVISFLWMWFSACKLHCCTM